MSHFLSTTSRQDPPTHLSAYPAGVVGEVYASAQNVTGEIDFNMRPADARQFADILIDAADAAEREERHEAAMTYAGESRRG